MDPFIIDSGIEAKLIRVWQVITHLQTSAVRRPIPTWEEDGEPCGIAEEDWDYENPDWWGPDHDRQMVFVCEAMKTYVVDCLMMSAPAFDLGELMKPPVEGDSSGFDELHGLAQEARVEAMELSFRREEPEAHKYVRIQHRCDMISQLSWYIPGIRRAENANDADPVWQFEQTRELITTAERHLRESGEW
ncbi:hypothetical protein [Agromyces mariniharenae]|uniref:Uncharacterized protein n=1 Tax=Agromyces mariniharenae TaxID=2604423 RepID=A0A5S4V1M6_9MICO|nr:hypothetical protein [Agromyces mariniharenae]TYL50420.1 hypothetical protein FYC51_14530 [Agromyces mariniharenae]